MARPSARRNILGGGLLWLVALAVASFHYLRGSSTETSFFLRHLTLLVSGPTFVLGSLGVLRGVKILALGEDWQAGQRPSRVWTWVRGHRQALLIGMTVLSSLVFGGLTGLIIRYPATKGIVPPPFRWLDGLVQRLVHGASAHGQAYVRIPWLDITRIVALLSGLVALVGLLSLLLPVLFSLLERRNFITFVGARHVRAHKSGFLTVISVLSIAGVGVSSCSLVTVISVMGGFGEDLKTKILGNNAQILVESKDPGGMDDWQEVLDRVRLVNGVVAATPVVSGEAMGSSRIANSGTLVRGVDPESIGNVIDLIKNIEVGKFDYMVHPEKLAEMPPTEIVGYTPDGFPIRKGIDLGAGSFFRGTKGKKKQEDEKLDEAVKKVLEPPDVLPGVIIGREVAKNLHVYVGDEITLISPMGDLGPMGIMPKLRKFRVAAIFYSGMYEYDASHVYMLLDQAQEMFSMEGKITSIDIKTQDGENAPLLRPAVEKAVARADLRVRDWRQLNRNLFSALKLERVVTFIILSLAVLVASFCIISTLLLMVTEKSKEIAILKSLGGSDRSILAIFMTEGVIIGAIGTLFGVSSGIALALGLSWYGIRLDPDVYYIDRLPIAIDWSQYGLVALSSLAICALVTLIPARAASKLNPVDGLRYE